MVRRQSMQIGHRERLCVYLGEGWSTLCAVSGRWRTSVRSKAVLQPAPVHRDSSTFEAILTPIDTWLQAHSARAGIDWSIGLGHVRYLLLPWDQRIGDEPFCQMLAAAMFAQQFPGDALGFRGYQLRLGPLSYGRPRIAALIPSELVNSVIALTHRHNCRVNRIIPMLSVVWNHFFACFRAGTGTLALVEDRRLLRVTYDRGQMTSLAIQPYSRERTHIPTEKGAWRFPPRDTTAPVTGELTLPSLAPDDDVRVAYALCGAT
jgi:hypothetical protein